MRIAGVISGTSVDGIDVGLIHVEKHIEVIGHHTVPYPPGVREAILAVSNANTHTSAIARLNFLLGEVFADAVIQTCKKLDIPLASLNLIGSHGQTIYHESDPVEMFGYQIASTMQIGEPSVIAKRTGVFTIADFRPDDIAAGGTGAPLVPSVDYRLFRDLEICRIALNIGGIANMTMIPAGASIEDVVACDIGPGNMVMDQLMGDAGYDRNGETARSGKVHTELLEELLADPYYRKAPPKSTGREQFGAEFVKRLAHLSQPDAVATALELTVRTIACAIARYPEAREIIVSGGGARNLYLMERLRESIDRQVKTSEDFGIPIDGKEAIAFAILAYESFHGRPGNVPGATGAQRAVILGKGCVP